MSQPRAERRGQAIYLGSELVGIMISPAEAQLVVDAISRRRTRFPGSDHGERCDVCGRNITWFAPSPIWNAACPNRLNILCPTCFVVRHERTTGERHAWIVRPETDEDLADVAFRREVRALRSEVEAVRDEMRQDDKDREDFYADGANIGAVWYSPVLRWAARLDKALGVATPEETTEGKAK